MKDRLKKLKSILGQLRSESFGEAYGIGDFVEGNEALKEQSNQLSIEVEFYNKIIKEINSLL